MSDYILGRNGVTEALRAKVPATELLVAAKIDIDERVQEALRFAKNSGLKVSEYPRARLDAIVKTTNHQGLALAVKPFNYADFDSLIAHPTRKSEGGDGAPKLILGLDGITDPHNLGAIIRSGMAFGVDGVVIPERRSADVSGTVWKTSAGAAARMKIAQVTNMVRSIEDAKKAGFFVVGLDMEGKESLPKFSLADEPLYIIVGSEGKGISRLAREKCDLILSIPMESEFESLNASVATAISLYSIVQQRKSEH
jgi:23S rRNA (guanosine2251-2'-O)-methyltransferase